MAKRTRGSNRPGQRHPDRHGSARPQSRPEPRRSGGLSESEEARAAELESQIVARDRDAETSRARARDRGRVEIARPGRAGGQGLLAARAAEEYGYVVRDVRRILVVGGTIIAALFVLFVLIDVVHVVTVT
ncbi:MAG: hypothetical protein ACHQ01_01990 [Candidatus Limnocylindrales bacterium]